LIDLQQVKAEFLQLVQIDSPSYRESGVAAWLIGKLAEIGVEAEDDGRAGVFGGTCGNLIARVPGADVPALLLNAHMDNVPPCEGVKPVLDGDIVRTDGTTILGGDDKCGCLAILAAVREVVTNDLPHPPLEIVFTAAEETGLEGAKALDYTRLAARRGIVAESGTVGVVTVKAPSADRWDAVFHGQAAHAGVAPEKGINAIRMASEAIAAMQVGRLDDETTANVGLIQGGDARNVVPPRCSVAGEARSHDPTRLAAQMADVRRCVEEAAARHKGRVDLAVSRSYDAFSVEPGAWPRAVSEQAARDVGLDPVARPTGGGSDANILSAHGLTCVILGCGSTEVHTPNEHIDLRDLYAACEWMTRILELAAQG
jgi:tripeptide aminopeptidase